MTETEPEIAMVLGTRPEIIKFAPVIRECERQDVAYVVVHTGQHYSHTLDRVFFEQLELPTPDHHLGVGSGAHGEQTAAMIKALEELLLEEQPAVTLVQGDTNSTLAGGIVASKLDTDVGHIEAGLRSFDEEMPEEINRRVTDHVSDICFAPTPESAIRLQQEGIDEERIVVTGNTIVDAVQQNRALAEEKSSVLADHDLTPDEFCLLTAHRAENVDDPERFEQLLAGVNLFARTADLDVIYPIHPRAAERLEGFDLAVPDRIELVEPQDFLDFLRLEQTARLVFTDSGGVQEETCILSTPCVTLRNNTERPEAISVGANQLAGVEPASILQTASEMDDVERDWSIPFGDGDAAKRIVRKIRGENVSQPETVRGPAQRGRQ